MGGRCLRGLGRVQGNIEMEDSEDRTGETAVQQQGKGLGSNEDAIIFVLQVALQRASAVAVKSWCTFLSARLKLNFESEISTQTEYSTHQKKSI